MGGWEVEAINRFSVERWKGFHTLLFGRSPINMRRTMIMGSEILFGSTPSIFQMSQISQWCVWVCLVWESAVCHVCSLSLPGHDRYKLSAALGTSLATPDSVMGASDLNCSDHNLIIVPDREITATRIIDKVQTKSPNCKWPGNLSICGQYGLSLPNRVLILVITVHNVSMP